LSRNAYLHLLIHRAKKGQGETNFAIQKSEDGKEVGGIDLEVARCCEWKARKRWKIRVDSGKMTTMKYARRRYPSAPRSQFALKMKKRDKRACVNK
jgi:hypothetical protein